LAFVGAVSAENINPFVSQTLKNADYSDILTVLQPDKSWAPSQVYKSNDLYDAVKKMTEIGVGNLKLVGGQSKEDANMALVNLAAFLAQSMHETIKYDACDENNWDTTTQYTTANACGQLGQSYQDYKCSAEEAHMQCDVDTEMELVATTGAKWYGAPAPFFCAPKSKVPKAPKWNYSTPICTKVEERTPFTGDDFFKNVNGQMNDQNCSNEKGDKNVYEGQKAGGFEFCNGGACPNVAAPSFDQPAREDVEGCCWWGRGVIQTTGVCNFGKLNYFAGARAHREGRDSLYPDVDFCRTPNKICDSENHPDLKWVAGFFYWTKEVQSWPTDDKWNFNFMEELKAFTDAGNINDRTFIDKLSGIVNRGCPSLSDCPKGGVHEAGKRAQNFVTVLKAFGYPFGDTPITTAKPTTTQLRTTTAGPKTTDGPKTTNPSGKGSCGNGTCSAAQCVHNPAEQQGATDDDCSKCPGGQSWWPCNKAELCMCKDDSPVHP